MRHWWHSDANWQMRGVWRTYQCKCGHRKTELAYTGIMSPLPQGWPDTTDRHGQFGTTSGWVAPPPGGWPTSQLPTMVPPSPRRR